VARVWADSIAQSVTTIARIVGDKIANFEAAIRGCFDRGSQVWVASDCDARVSRHLGHGSCFRLDGVGPERPTFPPAAIGNRAKIPPRLF
jgi:hypothetical protein